MESQIALIRNYFATQPVVTAFLFGSTARGDNDSQSDIDILVELSEEADLFDLTHMKQELQVLCKKSVDLVSSKGLSPRIRPFIDKDKLLIYERKQGDLQRLHHIAEAIADIQQFMGDISYDEYQKDYKLRLATVNF